MTDEQALTLFLDLAAHLDDEAAALWRAYIEAEYRNIRPVWRQQLQAFIARARQTPPEALRPWLDAYCDAIAASGITSRSWSEFVPVRYNLLEAIVLPPLLDDYHRANPEAVRRLVVLTDFFYYQGSHGILPAFHMPELKQDFLRQALRINPDDARALDKLIDAISDRLAYTIHEVPWGVLMGPLEGELIDLAEFETLVRRAGTFEEWAPLIRRVRTYMVAWDGYRADQQAYGSFVDYLTAHDIPLSRHLA